MFRTPPEPNRSSLLLVVAAPGEAEAIRRAFDRPSPDNQAAARPDRSGPWAIEALASGVSMVCTGVGKSQAAGAAAWACGTISCQGVLSIGLGGVLPKPPHEVGVGAAVLASRSLFADEGGLTPDGFRSIDAMGFPVAAFGETGMPCDPMWAAPLGRVADATGWIATVSTCSGTDASARTVADRTGAIVENMEGAAVAAAISRLPKPPRFAEIRVISNTTGDRGAQQWDLPRALDRLGVVALAAAEAILAVDDPDP